MPIDIEKFHAAARPLGDRILDFLKAHPREAFNALELMVEIENIDLENKTKRLYVMFQVLERKGLLHDYDLELDRLVREGRVEKASINGVEHFALGKTK